MASFDYFPEARARAVTFADPLEDRPFSETLYGAARATVDNPVSRAAKSGAAFLADPFLRPAAEIGAAARDVALQPESYADLVRAAEARQRLVDTINAKESAAIEAVDHRIETARRLTGVVLENPFRQGYHIEANRRVDAARARGEVIGHRGPRVLSEQVAIFNEKLDELAQNFPDRAAGLQFGQSIDEQAQSIMQAAQDEAVRQEARPRNALASLGAELAGGLWGMRRDPLFVTSLFFGPTTSAGETVLARIGSAAWRQGFFNMGLTALEQPSVQEWRRSVGARHGVMPAAEEVGLSFLFGAIPGAGIQGGIEAIRAGRAPLERILRGTPQQGDAFEAARALGVNLDEETRRAIHAGEISLAADRAAVPGAPDGISPEQHADAVRQAVNHAEASAQHAPPEITTPLPPRAADQVKIIDEAQPARIGEREIVDGKTVEFRSFAAGELRTDAQQFQFKSGGDQEGVIDTLRGVSRWDPLASGKVFVFERADGAQIVADGHQRAALAKRLSATGSASDIRLHGYLFREADGWTPADVRALAAKKNIQEGSGSALDVARILRDRPDILDGSLPVTQPALKTGIDLARLSDEAFGMAINGVVRPGQAALVGAMVADRAAHAGVLADLARVGLETEREARLFIGEIMAAGFRSEEQIGLFGAETMTRSLMRERVKVLDAALTTVGRDKKLFGTLAAKADDIEAAGNVLARDMNEARAATAAQLGEMLTRLARRTGPVSDALNRAAANTAEGMKPGAAANVFLAEMRALVERDGLAGLLAEPKLRPRVTVEPGTTEGSRMAETGMAARADSPARPRDVPATPPTSHDKTRQRSILGHGEADAAVQDFISSQHGRDLAALHGQAKILQKDIGDAGRRIASELGIEFKDPGVKSLATAAAKLARKGYRDAGQITDLARGAFLLTTPEQADQIAARLARRFAVLDEGWRVSKGGYLDRKILVRQADGTVGEIQIVAKELYQVKKASGQDLYDRFRELPEGDRREALQAQSRALYADAISRAGGEWAGILETSRGPNLGSNVARQASSDINAAVKTTSASSTLDHASPGASTAQATDPRSSTAGRQSQLQKSIDLPPEKNIGASAAGDKPAAEPDLIDRVSLGEKADGSDARLTSREAALAKADRAADHADLTLNCKD